MVQATKRRMSGTARLRGGAALCLAFLLAAAATGLIAARSSAEEARAVPLPTLDEPAAPAATPEVAVVAGGCFWGVQGVFQHVQGVTSAVSGYAGGGRATAAYPTVSAGGTGHAESVKITYDPSRISYGRILQIYFSVAHDPTQRDRQGPDVGTQYRSALFTTGPEQERIAKAYIAQLDQAHVYDRAIATSIEPARTFYPAEDYHQDFLTLNPDYPYIAANDLPKIEALKQLFPNTYRAEPVLVSGGQVSN
jgi:peptide-methionine (S)-S-oxide reductase